MLTSANHPCLCRLLHKESLAQAWCQLSLLCSQLPPLLSLSSPGSPAGQPLSAGSVSTNSKLLNLENISRCAEDVASCVATMAALYILHLSSLSFLLLEALLLLPGLPRPRPALLTAAGLLPSLAYTAATFGLLQPGLVSSNTRWAVASAAVPCADPDPLQPLLGGPGLAPLPPLPGPGLAARHRHPRRAGRRLLWLRGAGWILNTICIGNCVLNVVARV